jgi:hypothetical protein
MTTTTTQLWPGDLERFKPSAIPEQIAVILRDLAIPEIRFSRLAPRDAALVLRPDLLGADERSRWGEMRLPQRATMVIHPEHLLEILGMARSDIEELPLGWALRPHPVPTTADAIMSWPLQPLTERQLEAVRRLPTRIAVETAA